MGAHQPRLVEVKTFAAVLGSILVVGALGSSVLFQAVEDRFLELQISANRRHARYLAEVVALRLENGVSRAEVLADLQNSRTASETGFVCVLDPGGTVLTHPDPAMIATSVTDMVMRVPGSGLVTTYGAVVGQPGMSGGVLADTQIVGIWQVAGEPLIVAAH